MATRLHLLIALVALAPAFCGADSDYRIISQDPQHLSLEITVPLPQITTIHKGDTTCSRISVPDWPGSANGLPYLAITMQLASDRAVLHLVSAGNDTAIAVPAPLPAFEQALGDSTTAAAIHRLSEESDVAPTLLRYDGACGRLHLWTLKCRPFRYENGLLKFPRQLVCTITNTIADAGLQTVLVDEQKRLTDLGVAVTTAQTTVKRAGSPLFKNQTSGGPRVKMYLDQDGLYHITGRDLAAAGLSLPDLEIKGLRLQCNNVQIPIYVSGWQDGRFGADDYFEFWGEYLRQTIQQQAHEAYQDPFSRTNVYWLSWDGAAGTWMSEEPAGAVDVKSPLYQRPFSFYETVHVEADHYFDRLSDVQEPDSLRDLWFMDAGISSGSKRQYEVNLACPDFKSPLAVRVRAWLSGRSTLATEHKVSVFLNDERVLAGSGWRQSLMHLQTADAQGPMVTALTDGRNTLTVINEADAAEIDYVMLNWFEVTYPRLYRARDGQVKFTIPPDFELGSFLFQIDGFNDRHVDIYKIGAGKMVGARVEKKISADGLESFAVTMQDEVQSRATEYVAIEPSAKRKPLRLELAGPAWQFDSQVAVDYLVVTARRFASSPSLKKLISHRQSQGYHVSLVTVEDLYDAFAAGRYGSQAVKSALQWFYQQSRAPQLKYVLLVGDGCYDRNDAAGDSLDLVPVHFRQTVRYGATATDHWYALLSGDDEIPDVHIGRLPVRTEQELAVVVDKIVHQESDPYNSDWRHRLLFIGGNGQEFRDRASALAYHTPPAWDSRMLFTIRSPQAFDPFFGSTADLLDYIDEGCAVINFHGHGGGAIWSDNGLLQLEDVQRMSNRNRYPLVLSMTCFTGAFEAATNQSLADAMLFAADRGASAFFGASGLGWLTNDDLLQQEIMHYFYEHPQQTLGEILDAGKIRYYTRYYSDIAVSQVIQYNLLGDPAARLPVPQQTLAMTLPAQVAERGDTLQAMVDLPLSRAALRWQLLDSTLVVLESRSQLGSTAPARNTFVIPNTFAASQGFIRLFAGDELGKTCFHAAAPFSLNGLVFDSVRVTAKGGDSVAFMVRIRSTVPVRQGRCRIYDSELNLTAAAGDWYTTPFYYLPVNMSQVRFRFTVTLSDERTFMSPWQERAVREVPDLGFAAHSLRWTGTDSPGLAISVTNRGSGKAEGYYLHLHEADREAKGWQRIGMAALNCPAFGTVEVVVPYGPATGEHFVRFIVDADTSIDNGFVTQSVAQVQTIAFACRPQTGIEGQDTLRYDSHLCVIAPPGAFAESGVLFIQTNPRPSFYEQPDFSFGSWDRSYRISFSKATPLARPVRLAVPVDSTGFASLYRFSGSTQKWLRQPGSRQGRTLVTEVSEWGEYAVLYGLDEKPPVVAMHVDARPYQPHMLVALQPQITVMAQDQNGIDLSSVQVTVDGRPHEALVLPDSIQNANQIQVSGIVPLTPGEHRLSVSLRDCFGNAGDPVDMVIDVAADFHLTVLGNYPNPFATSTTFAYTLTQPAEQLRLKIFSGAGRLLRTLDPQQEGQDPNPLGTDYHEITWDGCDEQGYDVANGVYFFKFSARYKGEHKEVMGKMARIR